jgi:hypothetical protein
VLLKLINLTEHLKVQISQQYNHLVILDQVLLVLLVSFRFERLGSDVFEHLAAAFLVEDRQVDIEYAETRIIKFEPTNRRTRISQRARTD